MNAFFCFSCAHALMSDTPFVRACFYMCLLLCWTSGYNLNDLVREAQSRWLKPAEVLFILQNHENQMITNEPPQKPGSNHLMFYLLSAILKTLPFLVPDTLYGCFVGLT